MNLTKPGTYFKGYTNHYICIKSESSGGEGGINNAKKVPIANWVIMRIFNEVQQRMFYATHLLPGDY